MDEVIESFKVLLPQSIIDKLDYSKASLDIIEDWLLEKYPKISELEKQDYEGVARYVGETFRNELNTAIWSIQLDDEEIAFFGIPVLIGDKKIASPICPHALVTASIDRQKGTFFSTILNNLLKR
jgi:hypothetical protein